MARAAHIFSPLDDLQWTFVLPPSVCNADANDFWMLDTWNRIMEEEVARRNMPYGSTVYGPPPPGVSQTAVFSVPPSVVPMQELLEPQAPNSEDDEDFAPATSENSLQELNAHELNEEQKFSFEILRWHLDQTINNCSPPPLRLIMGGSGGTGKSRVIQTITEEFERRRVGIWLLKAAYTGITASLVDGKTLHFVGKIKFDESGRAEVDPKTKAKLQQFWRYHCYLVIDEYSMISKTFMAMLSKHIAIAKAGDDPAALNRLFGGINVILAGDLHQFPPVAKNQDVALFTPPLEYKDSVMAKLGATIYREFQTVVML